jgi:exopolyphosphatase/guanosine-5'-triphosphate,3'-diphosphate pyrophosphatase
MQTIAAIDVGSNAMRMVVGRIVYDEKVETVESLRLPVRLGQDAFTTGIISDETAQKALDAFSRFRRIANNHKVEEIRAIATSAMREAENRDLLIDRIARSTGIEVETISGCESCGQREGRSIRAEKRHVAVKPARHGRPDAGAMDA